MTSEPVDRLTALDASFLFIERAGLPLHIASIGTLEAAPLLDGDGRLRLDEIRAQVDARLDDLPRLRRRVQRSLLPGVRPRWVDDVHFDVAEHVDQVELPDGSDLDDLRAYAERLVAQPLVPDRPLWHLRFVTGLTDDRVGLVERVHHALADGVSGVDVATAVFDVVPTVEDPKKSTWTPERPARGAAVADELAAPLRFVPVVASMLRHPERSVRGSARLVRSFAALASDGFVAPRSSLNRPVGGRRRLAWISANLETVKKVGHAAGGRTNDVVLAAVAHGLRALLLERGEVLRTDSVLKVLVPVSQRVEDQHGSLGNRVAAMLFPLPVGIGDPADRLAAIASTSRRLKGADEPYATDLLLSAADLIPGGVISRMARLSDRQPMVNLVVTNVPGPPIPLFCRGARLLEAFPVVPLGGNLTVGVAVLSYDGALTLGITADPEHVPDLDVLRAGIEAGLTALGADAR